MRATVVLVAFVAFLAGRAGAESMSWNHTRGLTPVAKELIALAAQRSAVIRDLLEQLERSDVVALIEIAENNRGTGDRPFLRFLTPAADMRFVVIHITAIPPVPHLYIAILGHELQHALEIAGDPSVRDQDSCARLYTRIGFSSGERSFETQRARDTERRVREELTGRRVLF